MLKDPRTYEIMRPQDVGQPVARLVLGRHSGRHAVQSRCEALGFTLTHDELDQVYHAVIALGEHRKAIGDGELRRIVDRVRTRRRRTPARPERTSKRRLRTRRLMADARIAIEDRSELQHSAICNKSAI